MGGRILTTDNEGNFAKDGFDLGASWVWPYSQPQIAKVIDKLGLRLSPQSTSGDILFERMSKEPVHRYQSISEGNFSYRIRGGTSSIITAILANLECGDIHLNTRVTELSRERNKVKITALNGPTKISTYISEHVILALPPRLISSCIQFEPEIPEACNRKWLNTPTWMAPHAKFLAVYKASFWKEAGLSGTAQSMLGPLGEIHDATTQSGKPALFGFFSMPLSLRKKHDHRLLTEMCLAQLEKLFGEKAASPESTLIKDWGVDQFTATELDTHSSVNTVSDSIPWTPENWSGVITLAGSEVSEREAGYLEGAISAAESAVIKTLNRLGTASSIAVSGGSLSGL